MAHAISSTPYFRTVEHWTNAAGACRFGRLCAVHYFALALWSPWRAASGFARKAAWLASPLCLSESCALCRGRELKRTATADEKRYMRRVQEHGCILCLHLGFGVTPAEVHHVRVKHGWGRTSHSDVIGLCPPHHRGQPGGVHDMGRDEFTARYGVSEVELLEQVKEALG